MLNNLPHEHGNSKLKLHIYQHRPSDEVFEAVADAFKLVCDPIRLELFWFLSHTEECVINLAELTGSSSPAVCHHLKILKDGGILTSRKEGKEVYYKAVESEETELLHKAIESMFNMKRCPKEQTISGEEKALPLNENEETAHRVHDYLLENLDRRISVEELSRIFLINPTSLKESFKELYGTSLAAHIKEHRMEKSAELLTNSEQSVGDIAKAVGYTSQSKFAEAFSKHYSLSPLEYRKRHK